MTTDGVTLHVARIDVAQLVADSLDSAAQAAENNKRTLASQLQAPWRYSPNSSERVPLCSDPFKVSARD